MADYFEIFQLLLFDIGCASFSYLIISLQLCFGFPPFYRNLDFYFRSGAIKFSQEIPFIVFIFSGLFVSMFLMVLLETRLFCIGFIVFSIWGGIGVRRNIRKYVGGVEPWLVNSLTVKFPMLVFDIWAIGLSALIAIVLFFDRF